MIKKTFTVVLDSLLMLLFKVIVLNRCCVSKLFQFGYGSENLYQEEIMSY